jgi:hypothetical protein
VWHDNTCSIACQTFHLQIQKESFHQGVDPTVASPAHAAAMPSRSVQSPLDMSFPPQREISATPGRELFLAKNLTVHKIIVPDFIVSN